VNYLSFAGFTGEFQNTDRLVREGYYAFMDYAVIYWVRHLEASLGSLEKEDPDVLELSRTLQDFIELHYTNPTTRFPVSRGNINRLRALEDMSCYTELQQSVISTRKQLTFYGEMSDAEIALDLSDVVGRVRAVLERLLQTAQSGDTVSTQLEKHYGSNLFKCPRFSCKFFSNGFATAEQRDQHLDKHLRPFRCTVAGCLTGATGLKSERDLQKHMKDAHRGAQLGDEYPDENEVTRSLQQPQQQQQHLPDTRASGLPKNALQTQDSHNSSDNTANPLQQFRAIKRQKREHKCRDCGKTFSRKFNLDSHLHTHSTVRHWKCDVCGKAFARESDCKRHTKGHGAGEMFTCAGCGKGFARKDTLANHHKSKLGQRCLLGLPGSGGADQYVFQDLEIYEGYS